MMTQASSNPGGNVPAALLLLVAAVAGGYYLVADPLRSARPAEQPQAAFKHGGFEIVEARLWQDPLQAIRREWQYLIAQRVEKERLPGNADVPPNITSFARHFARKSQSATGPILVIAVMTPGGPYADDAEQRRRQRYALVSVLTASDYIPDEPTRLGYFVARTPPATERLAEGLMRPAHGSKATANGSTSNVDVVKLNSAPVFPEDYGSESPDADCQRISPHILIGYEVYRPIGRESSANWEQILVLWLSDEDFRRQPSIQIESLIAAITPNGMNASSECGGSPRMRCFGAVMIGPSNSDLLKQMLLDELAPKDPDERLEAIETFRRYWLQTPLSSKQILFGSVQKQSHSTNPPVPTNPPFPDPAMIPSPCDAECILDTTDRYLDHGLPPNAEQALRACLTETAPIASNGGNGRSQADCLDLPPLLEVSDSDPRWQVSVSKLITMPSAALDYSSREGRWISSILLATHMYLDEGIESLSAADVEDIAKCVYPEHSDGEVGDISACLKNNIDPTRESDPSWFDTVANVWRDSNDALRPNVELTRNVALQPYGGHLHVLSPRATVPIEFLAPALYPPEDGDSWQYFHPVIASDDAVLEAVVEEMSRRGLTCEAARNIAIVTELDSNYGLLLSFVLEKAIHNVTGCVVTVRSFGYLRGLDGEVTPGPGRSASINEARSGRQVARYSAQRANVNILPRDDERAVGRSQLDYLRRLAGHIGDQHTRLQDVGRRGFSAIGVLGADVYDKQLVIQALRDRLPGLTIFTTDLDARLSEAEARKWSRNLIIGSAYGLSLRSEHSRAPPPLRDSYQTAFFRAVQLALRIHEPGSSDEEYASLVRPATPRVFEIGRSGAIDVTVGDRSRSPNAQRRRETDALVHGSTGWPSEAGGIQMRLLRVAALSAPLLGLFFWVFPRSGG